MKTLIVIDMQVDFVTGVLGTPEAIAILPNVKRKIEEYIANGDEVIFTRDTHFDDYLDTSEGRHLPVPHCIKGTDGWQVCSEIDVAECEHINKFTFGVSDWSCVSRNDETGLCVVDRKFESIELIGVCTDICVASNALILKAMYPEVEITVDASCCAGVTPDAHKAALTTMKSCQINVVGG